MTRNNIWDKLPKKNKGQYRILGICVFLSVLLVTAFAVMYFSKAVQKLLPAGGDTRKLVWLLFLVTVIGCSIFTVYGANLFFRYKSREFGVFLALGESKKVLRARLAGELSAVIIKDVFWGIAAALPVSWLLWTFFERMLVDAEGTKFVPGFWGVAAGLLFAGMLSGCIALLGKKFVKRANIMDILNAKKKTEMVKEIKPWTGKLGCIMIVAGLVLAMAVPPVWANVFLQNLPQIWNVTWLLCIAGLYLFLLSAVGQSAKGRNPEKYYRSIVSTNLMRFTARQTTRNMCVITILVFVMLISAFWGVMYYHSAFDMDEKASADYALHYPALERQLSRQEIEEMAERNGVSITSFDAEKALELIIRYTERDMDDSGKYFDVEREKMASFLSASGFEALTGMPVSIDDGTYKAIVPVGYKRHIWYGPDCLGEVENPATGEVRALRYAGTAEYDSFTEMSAPYFFLISDGEYEKLAAGLGEEWKEEIVFFGVNDVMETHAFAMELRNAYIRRASALSDHLGYYDAREEELTLAAGEDYGYSGSIGLSADNAEMINDWKYKPVFRVLLKAEAMQLVGVFVLLSVYIAIISLAAIGVMSYVRSMTIAMDNRQLFESLKRLGANDAYQKRVIKAQLQKIFFYPALGGSLITMLFVLLMTVFNDMRLEAFEIRMILMEGGMMLLLWAYMYGIYRFSFEKMKKIIDL